MEENLTLYEVVTEDDLTYYIRTDLDPEVWVAEFEEETGKLVAEYDKVEELLTGLESVPEYQRWWAA